MRHLRMYQMLYFLCVNFCASLFNSKRKQIPSNTWQTVYQFGPRDTVMVLPISVSCLTSLSNLMLDIQVMARYAQTVTQDRILQNRPDYNLAVL